MHIPPQSMPCNTRPAKLLYLPDYEKTWMTGDTVKYFASSETEKVVAGLFWPFGLDCGVYFSKDHRVLYGVSEHAARIMARKENVEFSLKNSYKILKIVQSVDPVTDDIMKD